MKTTVLVTGATGYIGSHVVRRLLEIGWRVGIIVRPTSKYNLIGDIIDKVEVLCYNGDIEAMVDFMSDFKPDAVAHLAAAVITNPRSKDIKTIVRSNLEFGAELLEAMARCGVSAMVNTGTYWQNYNSKDYNPVDFYASTKEAFEKIIQYYVDAKSFKVITLRLPDIYGEDDRRPKIWNKLRQCALTGETIDMSPGEQEIDLVHVDDVAEAYIIALKRLSYLDSVSQTYSISSGHVRTLKQIVADFEAAIGKPINVIWGGKPYREREVMRHTSALEPLPGWYCEKSKRMFANSNTQG